jgi:hypothetical protein
VDRSRQEERHDAASDNSDQPFERRELIETTIKKTGVLAPGLKLKYGDGAVSNNSVLEDTCYGIVMTMQEAKGCAQHVLSNDGACNSKADLPVAMPPGTLRAVELVPRQSSLK